MIPQVQCTTYWRRQSLAYWPLKSSSMAATCHGYYQNLLSCGWPRIFQGIFQHNISTATLLKISLPEEHPSNPGKILAAKCSFMWGIKKSRWEYSLVTMKPKQDRQIQLTDSSSVNSVLTQLAWMGPSHWACSVFSEEKVEWRNWGFISILKLFYISL